MMRTATLSDQRLVASILAPSAHLVRFFPGAGRHYDRMIVVTERREGRELYLSGWIGKPLDRSEWLAACDPLLLAAEVVVFERLWADGVFWHCGSRSPR